METYLAIIEFGKKRCSMMRSIRLFIRIEIFINSKETCNHLKMNAILRIQNNGSSKG